MNSKAEKFIKLLKEIFEVDKSDLDFGIYRIMNHKRDVINKFLEEDLIKDIKEQIKNTNDDKESTEDKVYTHLVNFFSRYYEDGDFISQRRYKEGVYAIPYQGEEVKLHWANQDQYYIKSSENFKDYTFKVGDKKVHFKLVEANTGVNNNKPLDENKLFVLSNDNEWMEIYNNELIIKFQFKGVPKSSKQDKINSESIERIINKLVSEQKYKDFAIDLQQISATEKNKKRTILEKEIVNYTSKNSFDYFIHKDLSGFLNRELDFYIKNEILLLDDIGTDNEKNVLEYLDQVKIVKKIAKKVIQLLEQLENFQKKLWNKKKFIVDTNYCITLDRVPKKFYNEIIECKYQIEEWKELFNITENIDIKFLEDNKYLLIDTKFFNEEFKENIISEIDDIDKNTDGLLIHSDNFHAINILKRKYNESIDALYLDPPYNTSASEIMYKNSYKHSSWLTAMHNRISLSKSLLSNHGISCITIDDFEVDRLRLILRDIYGDDNFLGVCPIRNNPAGRSTVKGMSITHEYALFFGKSEEAVVGRLPRNQNQIDRYDQEDIKGRYEWVNFRKPGSTKEESPKMFYPIIITGDRKIVIPKMEWDENNREWVLQENIDNAYKVIYPIDENNQHRRWRWSVERVLENMEEFKVDKDRSGSDGIYVKGRMNNDGILPLTWWDKKEYSSTAYGTNLLKDIFVKLQTFSYPKALYAVKDSLRVANAGKDSIVLDYFAGSGTTAHATIELNREDDGNRKYIIVEMGEYFDIVTKPRIEKIIYSKTWKNGLPVDRDGISHMFKYIVLEQYEDSLNNIEFIDNKQLGFLHDNIKEEYTLSYMLEFETKDSNTFLNIDKLKNPFEYKLKIEKNGQTQYRNIDLVETFNYLLGLNVEEISRKEAYSYDGYELEKYFDGTFTFKRIEGKLNDGSKVLIVWRNLADDIKTDNDALNEYFKVKKIDTNEYDYIYINGDNTLEIDGRDNYKIKLIDEEFKRLMFEDIE